MTTINNETGLPIVPGEYFWRVEETTSYGRVKYTVSLYRRVSYHYDYSFTEKLNYWFQFKSVPYHVVREERIVTEPITYRDSTVYATRKEAEDAADRRTGPENIVWHPIDQLKDPATWETNEDGEKVVTKGATYEYVLYTHTLFDKSLQASAIRAYENARHSIRENRISQDEKRLLGDYPPKRV